LRYTARALAAARDRRCAWTRGRSKFAVIRSPAYASSFWQAPDSSQTELPRPAGGIVTRA
jgi:hypothetical protein